jgi:hypothetical protein
MYNRSKGRMMVLKIRDKVLNVRKSFFSFTTE